MPEYHRNTEEEMDVLLEKIDLSQPAPTEEPMRQYYFIKKAKEYVKKAEEAAGRPLTACHYYVWMPDECKRFRETGRNS